MGSDSTRALANPPGNLIANAIGGVPAMNANRHPLERASVPAQIHNYLRVFRVAFRRDRADDFVILPTNGVPRDDGEVG